jgi:anaerobic ribonucleoside-triphosphate reductase activating protein
LVGGEPFDQATALAEFARLVRKQGLSVVTFTGYELEQIIAADRDDWLELLRLTDLLLDGPFRVNLADVSRPWVGSKNQRFHFLTDRYRHLEAQLTELPNRLEIRIESDGRIQINGMASSEDLQDLFDSLASEHL